MDDSRNIVICGAGVIGAAVADSLTQRGVAPTIIERAEPAASASGRAGGFLALDWNDDNPMGPLTRASFALHAELAIRLGPENIGYRRIETIMVAAADTLSVDQYRAMESPAWLDGNVAAHSMIGSTETTAQVDPYRFTTALIASAQDGGAELVIGKVGGLDRSGSDGSVTGVHVDGALVPADIVVLALGAWTNRVAHDLGLPTVHARKGASVTLAADVPAQAVFSEFIHADGRRIGPEIYPRPGGEVYVNGIPDEGALLPDDPRDVSPAPGHCEELHRIAGMHSHVLRDAPIVAERACFRPLTRDGLPLIGPVPGAPGVYLATAHSQWGILNAPATGRMVAEMILDGESTSVDPRPFDLRRVPPGM